MSNNQESPPRVANRSVDDRDLMALADGRIDLDSEYAAGLRAYLAAHPRDAARVAAWQRQNEAIRARYASVVAESVPPHLQPEALREQQARRQSGRRRFAVAASMAALAVASALGLSVGQDGAGDPELDRFASEVLQWSTAALPVGSQAAGVGGGADSRLEGIPSLDLAGFTLTERRTLRAGEYRATKSRYEGPRGQRVHLFVAEEADARRPELRRMQRDGHEIVYWRENGRMYALAAETMENTRLQQIVTATMRQGPQHHRQPKPATSGTPGQLRQSPAISANALKTHDASQRQPAPVENAPSGVVYDSVRDESL